MLPRLALVSDGKPRKGQLQTDPRAQECIAHKEIAKGREAQGCGCGGSGEGIFGYSKPQKYCNQEKKTKRIALAFPIAHLTCLAQVHDSISRQ
jgi:hypothetical protein